MNELFTTSAFAGVTLSLLSYMLIVGILLDISLKKSTTYKYR